MWPYHPPMCDELPTQSPDEEPTPASVLRELLECTELNLDDLEEHTRTMITKARARFGIRVLRDTELLDELRQSAAGDKPTGD